MIKNKIAAKLTLYFATILLFFSIIIGSIFILFFRGHTIQLHKQALEEKAFRIAQTITNFNVEGKYRQGEHKGNLGYGAYVKFLKEFSLEDVWIVDGNLMLNMCGNRMYTYKDLPPNAERVINEVFEGKTAFSESFSNLLDTHTLTVGTPIKGEEGEITGVVLLHSPVSGINMAIKQGINMLVMSMLIALVFATLLAVAFSITFTKPLNTMKNTAHGLSKGEYNLRNHITQKDEVGELAKTIDILAEHLELADKQSEKLEKIRQDFVANISHELRTPVTIIRGSLEALYDGVVVEPQQIKSYYEQMLIEAKGLQRLIGDLLDLSKLQNKEFVIEKEPVNLGNVIDDVVRSTRNIAINKEIQIEVEGERNNFDLLGDYGRLRQMFIIIMDNAIKFSPYKGKIKISFIEQEPFKISIYNEGAPIANEDLPYIFDRFYKTKAVENKTGTGLGLSIANQIAMRHHIDIQVQNGQRKGCEFIFVLKD